jgi:hypothetical protein
MPASDAGSPPLGPLEHAAIPNKDALAGIQSNRLKVFVDRLMLVISLVLVRCWLFRLFWTSSKGALHGADALVSLLLRAILGGS